MIVVRRPTLFDVDVVGLAIVAGMVLLGWLGIVQPQRAVSSERAELRRAVGAAEQRLTDMRERLASVATDMQRLQAGVADRLVEIPQVTQATRFIGLLTDAAGEAGVTIGELQPYPLRGHDAYYALEFDLAGEATSLELTRLIDEIFRRNSYFAIEKLSLTRTAQDDGSCRFDLRIRFFMLREDGFSTAAAGDDA